MTGDDGAPRAAGSDPSGYRRASDAEIAAEHAEWRRTRTAALLQLSGAGITVLEAAGSAIDAMIELLRSYRSQLEAEETLGPFTPDAEPATRGRRRRRIDVAD
jgi:hypothetical protein